MLKIVETLFLRNSELPNSTKHLFKHCSENWLTFVRPVLSPCSRKYKSAKLLDIVSPNECSTKTVSVTFWPYFPSNNSFPQILSNHFYSFSVLCSFSLYFSCSLKNTEYVLSILFYFCYWLIARLYLFRSCSWVYLSLFICKYSFKNLL